MTMTRTTDDQLRQGDVLLVKGAKVTAQHADVTPKDAPLVLAHGEVTGHSHRFELQAGDDGSAAYAIGGDLAIVRVVRPQALVHDEHSTVPVKPADWRVSRPYEFRGESLPRRVAD
jgi:hypothetical protein